MSNVDALTVDSASATVNYSIERCLDFVKVALNKGYGNKKAESKKPEYFALINLFYLTQDNIDYELHYSELCSRLSAYMVAIGFVTSNGHMTDVWQKDEAFFAFEKDYNWVDDIVTLFTYCLGIDKAIENFNATKAMVAKVTKEETDEKAAV